MKLLKSVKFPPCGGGDLVFHGRVGNERSCFRHISVITCPFFLVSVMFPVTFSLKTHVQHGTINVSEILPLRTIKVDKSKFTLEIGH